MAKYICIKSLTKDVPVGTELVGKYHSPGRFILTEDSKLKCVSGTGPRWYKDDQLPLAGALWVWQCQDPIKALERYEKAVRAHEMLGAQDPEDWPGIEKEYESAKAELLNHLY
ncbi:hypothetical protein ECBP1_0003 [Escherichia phage ECBP1]|uniref:Uncharacterized protein n=1 Tax=Escherichia phage ECBP1 TaxID=1604356 RepID=J9SSU7_9CAUD|nr:hypothetical protein ECBP1_0003 [Escherichia phage ECBP1]AFR51954.1 hypothetical protein ECBP1_0003 [Escherichia phage ECBP1]